MKVLLINPPYQTLTSNLGVGHQIPLGLLMIGGPLLDRGFEVELLDAEVHHLSIAEIVDKVHRGDADVVMTGHAGSTPAHPVCMDMLDAIRVACPKAITVYGGVYPTYHDLMILKEYPAVDVIVRGEGEATALELCQTLRSSTCSTELSDCLVDIPSISYRGLISPVRNPDRPPNRDLDQHRVGWELIQDWDLYQCFGLGRSAIVQFSRGCPHRCTYCGQHGFWQSWRHRDPVKLADEIQWLHDVHGIRFITLADENPTTSPKLWKQFLQEVASRSIDVEFFTTLRAADIVRDAEFIDLYRQAGILYVLLGIDATDPQLIQTIRKRSSTTIDGQACALLRKAGIRSIIAHIVGLGEDSWSSFWRAFRTLCRYDGDLLNVMYATPHTWTQFARDSADRLVAQEDQSCWDYRHQVMHEKQMKPWQLFLAVKALELAFHLRPRVLWRMTFDGNWRMRWQRLWTQLHITMVWWGEVCEFVFKTRFAKEPKPLRDWLDRTKVQCEEVDPRPQSRTAIRIRGRELSVTAR